MTAGAGEVVMAQVRDGATHGVDEHVPGSHQEWASHNHTDDKTPSLVPCRHYLHYAHHTPAQ